MMMDKKAVISWLKWQPAPIKQASKVTLEKSPVWPRVSKTTLQLKSKMPSMMGRKKKMK